MTPKHLSVDLSREHRRELTAQLVGWPDETSPVIENHPVRWHYEKVAFLFDRFDLAAHRADFMLHQNGRPVNGHMRGVMGAVGEALVPPDCFWRPKWHVSFLGGKCFG